MAVAAGESPYCMLCLTCWKSQGSCVEKSIGQRWYRNQDAYQKAIPAACGCEWPNLNAVCLLAHAWHRG